jgi:hypothetical protein
MLSFPRRPMMARLVMLFGICLFTAGAQFSCSSDGSASIGDDDLDSGNGTRFTTRLVLRNSAGTESYTFARGDLITFELTVRNRTDQTVTLAGCCPPDREFFVFEEDSRRLRWKWTEGRAFPAVVQDLVFTPQETKIFLAEWNQVTASGEMIAAGEYEARGAVPFVQIQADPLAPGELASNLRSFTVR